MIQSQHVAALALPQLAPAIPLQYVVPGADAMSVPLTIALLEAGVISDAMLRSRSNATLAEVFGGEDELHLSARALSHWWTRLIRERPSKFFRWSLHVQQLDTAQPEYPMATTAWFCLTRIDGEIPRFALAPGVERLEATLEGFGQTVLAVLREACLLLPESFNPWIALDWVHYLHWNHSSTDEELIEDCRLLNGYATAQEVLDNLDLLTRAKFYEKMPKWVCAPKRVLSREAIEGAGGGKLERGVIEVCDALHTLVNQPDFILRPHNRGVYRCGQDTVDASMVLLWKQHDVIGQVIDDYLESTGSTGEYCEFIDASPVPMTAEGVREFQTLTEQMIQVAVLTEKLILMLGEPF